MKKKISKNTPTMANRSTIIIAAITFVLGFFAGAGFMFFKTDSPPSKVKELEAEVINNPQNTDAWIHLGHVYFDTDKYDQAIMAYEKAIKLDPSNADVLTDLGIMYRRKGQFRKAIEKFDKATAVDPKHQNARLNKGIVLMHDLSDRDSAIQTWEDLLEINPFVMVANNQSLDQLVKHYKDSHDKNTSN